MQEKDPPFKGVACLLKRHRVRLRSLHGLYAFGSQRQWLDEAYERAITARSPLPVSFHYIGPFLMEALHNRFARLTESRDTALPQDENIRSASPVPAELREIHLRGLQIFKVHRQSESVWIIGLRRQSNYCMWSLIRI